MTRQVNDQAYEVETSDGRTYKENRVHIRHTDEKPPNINELQVLTQMEQSNTEDIFDIAPTPKAHILIVNTLVKTTTCIGNRTVNTPNPGYVTSPVPLALTRAPRNVKPPKYVNDYVTK